MLYSIEFSLNYGRREGGRRPADILSFSAEKEIYMEGASL